jgi:hypothetical protein
MLFSLIKANIRKQKNNLNTPFVAKSKFLNLELKKCAVFTDFRVDYVPLIKSQTSYQSLIRAWYLVLATRSVQVPIIAGKMAVFPYRRTKLFAKYIDTYDLSLHKNFYETLMEHRNLFYCLSVSTSAIDRLFLILCLYYFKSNTSRVITIVKPQTIPDSFHDNLIIFILQNKWKFKVVEFLR